MTVVLRSARTRHAVGVRELARRCGVSAPTVVGWERSEAAGTLQAKTLQRALAALGESATVTSAPVRSDPAGLLRREERLGLELHRSIAKKLIDDPERVLGIARDRIPNIRDRVRGGAVQWVDYWENLIDARRLGTIVDVMLGTTRADIDLRSVSPFVGLLSEAERQAVLGRVIAK